MLLLNNAQWSAENHQYQFLSFWFDQSGTDEPTIYRTLDDRDSQYTTIIVLF